MKLVFFVVLGLMAGCATLPTGFERPVTTALPEPYMDRLGQFYEAEMNANPGKSGYDLLGDSLDALVARGLLAEVAEKTLDLQYYIFRGDETSVLILNWVMNSADRGVRVRILVDDLGTMGKDGVMSMLAVHPNIDIRVFNPFSQRSGLKSDLIFVGRAERRMHNKAFIVDNVAAVIGGRNIGNEYFAASDARMFLDLDVLAVGSVVRDISASFDSFWNSEWAYPAEALYGKQVAAGSLDEVRAYLRESAARLVDTPYREAVENSDLYGRIQERDFSLVWAKGDFYYDRPEKIGAALEDKTYNAGPEVRHLFEDVEHELVLVTPYFVPREEGTAYLVGLVERGVKVKVMTNSLATNDAWIVHCGYAPYRQPLLSGGVKLYELNAAAFKKHREKFRKYVDIKDLRLHVKAVVVDRRYVLMGSSNFDPRSNVYNTEVGLVVDSPELAGQMLDGFEKLMAPENRFRLYLEDMKDDYGMVRRKVRWETVEDGEVVVYRSEPGAGFWRTLGAWFMRIFPIEGKL